MTAAPAARATTTVVSRPVAAAGPLLDSLPSPHGTLSFVRRGSGPGSVTRTSPPAEEGLVGWGEYARITVTGPDAAERIGAWFAELSASLAVDDQVGVRGTGPVAFVSLGFDDDDPSVAVVPQVVRGRFAGRDFVTAIDASPYDAATRARSPLTGFGPVRPARSPGPVTYEDPDAATAEYTAAVVEAGRRIRRGDLDKVVIAQELRATTGRPVDERFLLHHLARRYPDCWTFAVDGLVGATPELLLRREGDTVTSRVLAGTTWSGGAELTGGSLGTPKNVAEHGYAVRSVAEVLATVCENLVVPDPEPLVLANLTHLSTTLVGRLTGAPSGTAPSALALAAALHPTAAVGGSPTAAARVVIRELEGRGRGRYAAPVGWITPDGDGELGIALRCAQVDGRSVRLQAGCGIVAESDPGTEAREAAVKMIPMRDALENRLR